MTERYGPESLTVAIVSYNSRSTIGRALDALARQTTLGFETLVIDSSDDGTEIQIAKLYPGARLVHFAERHFPGKARNAAMRHRDRELIAFVDADCIAEPDWVERILAAHNDPANANRWIIGGSVGVANPESTAGWASFFCEFSPWLRGGPSRPLTDIATCCYSMKRTAFERFGPFVEDGYCSDTVFNWRAGAEGQSPLFVPGIHVRHINPTGMRRIAAKQRMHGERFAGIRAREKRWSRSRSLFSAVTAPLLPLYLWVRTGLRVLRAPGYRKAFLRATPCLWCVSIAWSWGEARGYLRAAL